MGNQIAVVCPRPLPSLEAVTDTTRLRDIVAQLLNQPPTSVELAVAPAAIREVLNQQHLTAALWLPAGVVPTEACQRVLHGGHGIGVWTGRSSTLERAYSFGPVALAAHACCMEGNCAPRTANAAAVARHLVTRHRVPIAGPQPGLAPWRDGEQRARLLLGGKDVALRRLAALLPGVRVDTGVSVSWRQWVQNPRQVLAAIATRYSERPVIVRSCCDSEDGWKQSRAGAYLSVPVPLPAPPETVAQAVQEVFASYETQLAPDARVLVQQWLTPVQASGVVTTRTLAGAPYYTAAVDTVSGRTDTVTAGMGQGQQTWYVRRTPSGSDHCAAGLPPAAAQLLHAAVETERCAGTSRLDVEVALADGAVHLLQARPLAAARAVDDAAVHHVADDARRQVVWLARRPWPCADVGVVLSNMADWNPVEMLGSHPAALATSLYQTLITDRTWAAQRAAYGYRDLRGTRLMHVVAGAPYVDAVASLASFLPAGLDEPLAGAVLRAMRERLVTDPAAHDKIEFEIAATCWTPDVAARTAYLAESGIGSAARRRLHEQLLGLTRGGVRRLAGDLTELDRTVPPLPGDTHPQELAATLAKARTVALKFAHVARAAFMATDLLRALERNELAEHREVWMRSLDTPATVMQQNAARVAAGQLNWDTFVARYRWIRPGTYDLAIPTYGDDPNGYLRPLLVHPSATADGTVAAPWNKRQAVAVTRAVAPLGLDAKGLEAFCRAAITGRERGKALYAAWVSAALEAIAARGAAHGIGREDMRHLHVNEVDAVQPGRWPHLIARRRARVEACTLIELPDVITCAEDLDCFSRGWGRSNFVTTSQAFGPVHTVPTPACPPLPGAVIVLETADPGFDWIFAHQPAALVTAYGGTNSHMAIRCAELGVPAAIGVGPATHATCAAARSVSVNAAARRVDVLS